MKYFVVLSVSRQSRSLEKDTHLVPMESLSPPRSSTSEPPPPSHGLTAGFDNQMKMLQYSYLGFFLERKRIEDQ
jgi:hypothetical protein